jgi:type I restriction enzyme S subunit
VFDSLKCADVPKFELPIPPLHEQERIADFLGAVDDKIELNRRMSETLEAMARALFKSWFVDFDPVRAKAEGRWRNGESLLGLPAHLFDLFPDSFEDSEIGEIPSGWSVQGLDQIARFLNGLALQKFPPNGDDSLPVVKIAQLRAGNTKDSDRASAGIPPDYVVQDGDVLFSWSGSLECVLWTGGAGALNQHLFKVSSSKFPKWFYYSWIRHHLPEFRRIAAAKATTIGHIQRHHLTQARIVVPPIEHLGDFSRYFDSLIDDLVLKSLESRTLAHLRDDLLPKLISGELMLTAD